MTATTTPTVWKSAFSPDYPTFGNQSVPQTIGLADGRILVVWEDDTNGPSPFIDVMGQFLAPDGTAEGDIFQVNSAVVASDETGPQIAAMPDGGFVMAYGGYLDAIGGFIAIQRYDSDGNSLASRFITDPLSSLTKWAITTDSAGNYTVAFERGVGHIAGTQLVIAKDVHSITYDGTTNGAGSEQSGLAQNSAAADSLGAIATFASGDLITVYSEPDSNIFNNHWSSLEFSITNPVTGAQIRGPSELAGEWGAAAIARDVVVLAGGQFVIAYSQSGAYKLMIGASEDPDASIDSAFTLPTFGSLGGVHLVALDDGGFFATYLATSSHVLYGLRYTSNGTPVGAVLPFATDVGSFLDSKLSLTADGRILVPYVDTFNEVKEVILDPRDSTIFGSDQGEAITTQVGSSVVYALGGDDTVYGQSGADTISGNDGTDVLRGGDGNDVYILKDVHRPDVFSHFTYDAIVETPTGGVDTVMVERVSPVVGGYTLPANVENAIITGPDSFFLNGNNSANTLTGNDAINTLSGAGGRDMLYGEGGNDLLRGDDGNDTLLAGDGDDTAEGGAGNDSISGGSGSDSLSGGAGNDVLTGEARQRHPGRRRWRRHIAGWCRRRCPWRRGRNG